MPLLQVAMPDEGTNAWIWVAAMLAAALAYLGPKIISLLTEDRNEWRSHAKELAEALRLNTQTLSKITDVVEAARVGDAELAREVRQAQEKTVALQERTLAIVEKLNGSSRTSARRTP